LLAKNKTFLLPHGVHLVRSVSEWGIEKKVSPEGRPLKLLFMACSAMDVEPELDFEQEEEAIFHITEKLAIDMDVEDSGSLEGLRSQLESEQYDVLHLSGHAGIDKNGRPYFIMEDETGYARRVFPDELWNEALIENPPRLLFLSGCRTAETPDSSALSDTPENIAEGSFARLLVEKHQVPAVLGWGRSVKDEQAGHAGKILFHQLSGGKSILEAVQRARFELIKNFPTIEKPAWPLLRLFSSGMPLGPIVKKGQQRRPKPQRMKHVYLKNSQVQVLAEGFVGRRRQVQTSLKALKRNPDKVGVALLGTGGLGKSCLAGKICERFPDFTLIIVHGRFNTITLGAALEDAFIASQDEKGQQILSQEIEMSDKLPNLCTTSFKVKNYLLLLDDFEQNLEGADRGEPGSLLPEAANLLNVLLHYLPHSGKMTQIIITSRYDFALSEHNRNLVEERLEKVWLTGFREPEQLKKVRELRNIYNYEERSLVPRLLKAGCGNPRLMEWLDVLVGRMAAVEIPQLWEAIKGKQEDFIKGHVIRELLLQGGKELGRFLQWFSIYRQPILEDAVKQVSEKAGIENWKELLREGMNLSLAEHDQVRQSYQVTALLREELLNSLEDHKACHEAAFVFYRGVCEGKDWINPVLTEEWIFHALGCGEEEVASLQGGKLINYLRGRLAFQESRRVGEWILAEKKQGLSSGNDGVLLSSLACTIDELGEPYKALTHLEQALSISLQAYGEGHPGVASILLNLGAAWRTLGQPAKAIDYYQQALSIDQSVYGKEHPDIALTFNNLGLAWYDLGEFKKAIAYYMQSLAIFKKIYGEKHPKTTDAINNLGLAWYSLGKHKKAIDYYRQAILIDQSVYGEEHPNVAGTLVSMGTVWISLGVYTKAIDYFQWALTIYKSLYGEKHPKVASALNSLGGAWEALGNHRQAISYFEQAFLVDRAVYGKEHPDCAVELTNLGAAWHSSGEYKKAIDCHRQALTIWKNLYGGKHPNVSTALNNLGVAWEALGEHNQAIEYFQQVLLIERTVYEEEHPKVAKTLNNIGGAWNSLGKHKKAIDYFQQALTIWRSNYGEKHPDVATALNNLGLAWEDLDEHKKAIDHYRQALDIELAVHGKEHPTVISCLNNLGSAWIALKDYKKAIDYCTQALSIYPMMKGEELSKLSVTLTILAGACSAQGLYRQALPYYEQTLAVVQKMNGEKHPDVASALNDLGLAWNALGEYKKAIDYHQRALDIYLAVYGEKHPKVAATLNNLGLAWKYLGAYKKVIDYYQKALEIYRSEYGEEHPNVVKELNNLGEAWRNLGQPEKAIDYFNQVLTIHKKTQREKQPEAAATLNNLGSTWVDIGEFEKAIDYYLQALSIAKAAFGEKYPHVATTLNNIGSAYFEWGKKEQAKEYLEQAHTIYNKFFGPEHPFTKNTGEWLKVSQ
jgi:tetratricopeptide (TPR) repeat protein